LKKYNLATIQTLSSEGVETFIIHSSGEWVSSGFLLINVEVSRGLSAAQAMGVATTYAKRYQLASMLSVSSEEDIDGTYRKRAKKTTPKHRTKKKLINLVK